MNFRKLFFTRRYVYLVIRAVFVSVLFMLFFRFSKGKWLFFDSIFLSGIVFICIGAFMLTLKLEFYDNLILGYRRLFGSTREEAIMVNKNKGQFFEPLSTGFLFVFVYLLHRVFM